MSYSERTLLGTSGITLDAWGKQKIISDHSLLHGLFTLDIPREKWLILENDQELYTGASAMAYSRNGSLYMDSKDGKIEVRSKRHPRYQPNRGHLYSSSIFLPAPTRDGIREFGVGTRDSGVFFRLVKEGLFAVAKTTGDDSLFLTEDGDTLIQESGFYLVSVLGGIIEDIRPIDTTGIDLEKGNIYDIQMQWRGVGDFKFFINQKLVRTFNYLGTLDGLSVFNPALPAFFKAENTGQDVVLKSGCVDISSEGGAEENVQYTSISAPELATSTTESVLLTFRIPKTVLTLENTRDCILAQLTAYSTDEALVRVYYTRTGVTGTFTPHGSGFQEYALNGAVTAFDKTHAELIATYRIGANQTGIFPNPLKNSRFYITNGDYIVLTVQGKNNSISGGNLEYGQEI